MRESSVKLPTQTSRRGRLFRGARRTKIAPATVIEKDGKHIVLVDNGGRLIRAKSHAAGRAVKGRQGFIIQVGEDEQNIILGKVERSRTAPKGRRSIISERAIKSMAADMDKRTKETIRKIGRSTGF